MVMVKTREWEIADLEKFEIQVTHKSGRRLNSQMHGLAAFGYDRALEGNKTVNQWRKSRFEASYPTYECRVLLGNGDEANGGTKLKNVRDSYDE